MPSGVEGGGAATGMDGVANRLSGMTMGGALHATAASSQDDSAHGGAGITTLHKLTSLTTTTLDLGV